MTDTLVVKAHGQSPSSRRAWIEIGMAVRDHTQEVHVMGSDEIHIYHAAVVHDNNRETVSIGTDAAVISD